MLERLVLKNAADCTSQRLTRASGVRVMIFVVFRSYWKSVAFFVFERYELVGCWLLVVGCWLLVVGCCCCCCCCCCLLLVVGCCLLAFVVGVSC